MKAVVQRVSYARLKVDGKDYSSIKEGLLILLGIGADDGLVDIQWLVNKLIQMRIFGDEEGKMNLSVQDSFPVYPSCLYKERKQAFIYLCSKTGCSYSIIRILFKGIKEKL
jgi:hypothetical protein